MKAKLNGYTVQPYFYTKTAKEMKKYEYRIINRWKQHTSYRVEFCPFIITFGPIVQGIEQKFSKLSMQVRVLLGLLQIMLP